jgi:hypothetical protein
VPTPELIALASRTRGTGIATALIGLLGTVIGIVVGYALTVVTQRRHDKRAAAVALAKLSAYLYHPKDFVDATLALDELRILLVASSVPNDAINALSRRVLDCNQSSWSFHAKLPDDTPAVEEQLKARYEVSQRAMMDYLVRPRWPWSESPKLV